MPARNSSSSLRNARLGHAVRGVVEQLEARSLFSVDPFDQVGTLQTLPYNLNFSTESAAGLHDKDGQHIGLTRVQVNKNGQAASYNANLLDLDTAAGVLKVTTSGSASLGSNYNSNNTLINGLETTFDATTSGFVVTARILGPLNFINEADEQAGIYVGPDQDNYIKLVAIARDEGARLQFVDEQTYNGVNTHSLNSIRDIGKFANMQTLDLRLEGDVGSGKVRAYYSINGSTFVKMPTELQLYGDKRTDFFSPVAKAGLIALHHNASGPMTVSYDSFSVEEGRTLAGRPTVTRTRPGNGAVDVSRDAFIAADLILPNAGIDTESLSAQTVKLYRTSDRSLVPSAVNTSGGGDTIVLQPRVLLEANTTYTFEVTDGVKDTAGGAFVPYTATFTTGTQGGNVDPSIAFEKIALPNTFGEQYTAVAMGPGNTALWAGTSDGKIIKFPINANGTFGTSTVYTSLQDANVGPRLITGFVFDPASTASSPILYVNHGFADIVNAPDWSSKMTKLSGSNLQTVQDLIVNLPRAVKDHLTNQPSFGPDGALYFNQGSMSAMGAADVQWGQRSEHLLSASILRLDLSKLTPGVPLDVKTEDGGNYNPWDANAPLKFYATGVRNAWDLVWTDDGKLYTATNGSAAGGNTPSTPSLPVPGSKRIDGDNDGNPANGQYSSPSVGGKLGVDQTMNDYLYLIEQGGYYGQPNPKRFEFVLNGGNPTGDVDIAEVPSYDIGTLPDRNWRGNVFDFGQNLSPNGMIQYKNATAFNGKLKDKLMVVRFSGGDDIIVLTPGSDGHIEQSQTGISGMGGFADPLDLAENTGNGNLYVAEYSESDPGLRRITLLRPIPPGPRVVPDKTQLVFSDIASGNSGGTGPSATQTVRIRNGGTEPMNFAAGAFSVIDDTNAADPASSGNDAPRFSILNAGSFPSSIAVGEFVDVQVNFNANAVGIESAFLQVVSNDPTYPEYLIPLRGVGTAGTAGADEPSLARILRAFRIPTIVGDGPNDSGEATNDYPVPPDASSQEVLMQSMTKAGAGQVTIELLALEGNQKNGVSSRIGYYKPGNRQDKNELFTTGADSRVLSPQIASGTTVFDPGTGAFGLYGVFPPFQDATKDKGLPREVFSEDALNLWESTAANRRKVRFFPLRDPSGAIVPDAYVFGFEEFDASHDANDVVGIIRNVKPAAAGPEIGIENVDGVPFSDRLVFSKIQDPVNSDNVPPQPDNKTHDTATLLVRNTGTGPLKIGSVNVGGQFTILNPPAANTVIQPGGSISLNVQFTATSGDIKTGTLTIGSDDADEPQVQVTLAGFWQSVSEQNQEPSLFELVDVFGFGTKIVNQGQLLTIPGEAGKIRRVGDEILSPYWRRADASSPVQVRQLSAFHNQGSMADLFYHKKGSNTVTRLFVGDADYGQTFLPLKDGESGPAAALFNPTDTFGWRIDGGEWSDPTKNTQPVGQPQDEGHHVRFWLVRDRAGQIVPNTYFMAMDYAGINYDYNDNTFLITNVAPDSPPTQPDNLGVTTVGSIKLNWSDNTEPNLAGYNVYRGTSGSGPFEKLNATGLLAESTFNDIFAPVGTQVFYQVKAVDNAGNESSPATVSATRNDDTTAPTAPSNVTAVAADGGITLDWVENVESDLAGYKVFRSASASGPWTLVTGSPVTASVFTDTNAPRGVQTFYQVTAVDQSGNESGPTMTSATRPSEAPAVPAAPTGVAAVPVSDTMITVSWDATPDANSYVLERRLPGAVTFDVVSSNVTATTFPDDGLAPDTTYEYRVRATNAAGPSAYSAVVSAKTEATPAPAPKQASVTDVAGNEPETGTSVLTFTISLDGPATEVVTVLYTTANGTATAGSDYTAAGGSVVFNPGEQTKTVNVTLLADALTEAAETFTLNLSAGSSGVAIGDGQAVGTINANTAGTTLPVGGKQQAVYNGADGKPVKVKLAGPGTAAVTVLSDGVARVTTSGTTAASTLTITGNTVVTDLLVDGSLKGITGKAVTLNGDVTVAGGVGKVTLGNVAGGGHTVSVGQGAPTAVTLGSVTDLSINSQSAIKSLKSAAWLDTGGTVDTINAPSIGSMTIKGDFTADVVTGALSKLSISGSMAGSQIRTTGSIGTVTAATMLGSRVFAGIGDGVGGLPASSADFVAPSSAIKSVTVKSKGTGAFSNTLIAAGSVGSVKLGSVTVANADTKFGVASMQTKSVAGATPAGKLALKNLADPSQSTAEDDFEVRVF